MRRAGHRPSATSVSDPLARRPHIGRESAQTSARRGDLERSPGENAIISPSRISVAPARSSCTSRVNPDLGTWQIAGPVGVEGAAAARWTGRAGSGASRCAARIPTGSRMRASDGRVRR